MTTFRGNCSPVKVALVGALLLLGTFTAVCRAEEPVDSDSPATAPDDTLDLGVTARRITVDQRERTYLVHVPPQYDAKRAAPVVVVLHGAGTNGAITVHFTGMNKKADEAGFLVVYPDGMGTGPFRVWNAGGWKGPQNGEAVDDVKFVSALLDDLSSRYNVDPKRIFATGMSNGGMMCYLLAAKMSDRIAAVAPVAGTMAIAEAHPKRPVPLLHFHGTDDTFVPFGGFPRRPTRLIAIKSVPESVEYWRKVNGCAATPVVEQFPDKADDGMTVQRTTYGPGRDGAEVILIEIAGGGHTWPGQPPPVGFIGKSTRDISANDLIWEFFEKHPLK